MGLTAPAAPGWDVRIYRRPAAEGEATHPVLHAATFPLPAGRGDYGSGAVEVMGPSDVMVMLLEFAPEVAGVGLFAPRGRPEAIDPSAFSTTSLQRAMRGQSGAQWFFTEQGRAFCLYVVLGSHVRRGRLVPLAASFVAGLAVDPPGAG